LTEPGIDRMNKIINRIDKCREKQVSTLIISGACKFCLQIR
jgi:hypothetical protein